MTPEQRAQRLEQMAEAKLPADAALLRECAGIWRERGQLQWNKFAWPHGRAAVYKRHILIVGKWDELTWDWDILKPGRVKKSVAMGIEGSLPAAQAAAVAWVDGQEGE